MKPKFYRGYFHCARCTRIVNRGHKNGRNLHYGRAERCIHCGLTVDWSEEE